MVERFDAIVIGAGIVGSACGYQLAKSRKKVLVLEQFSLGHNKGSSHGASRIIRYSSSSEAYLPLAIDAYTEWDELQRLRGGEKLYIQNGLLWLGDKNGADHRSRILTKYGVEHDRLIGKQIQERFPHLQNYGEEWHATYEPSGGTMLADKCLNAAQEQLKVFGGKIRDNEPVLHISSCDNGEVSVLTSLAKYSAKTLVVAAGGWLNHLLPGLPIGTEANMIGVNFWQIKERRDLFDPYAKKSAPNLIITELDEELYSIPGVDFRDKVKFGIHLGLPFNLRKEKPPKAKWMQDLPAKHITKHIPYLESDRPAVEHECVYTMSDDQNFIIDRHPLYPNILIAGGMSGTGFKFALTVGKIITRMANKEPEGFLMDSFRLSREVHEHLKAKL